MNEALRQALANTHLTDAEVATRLGVNPKTVRRWLFGQRPYPRHQLAVAELTGASRAELWPENKKTDLKHSDSTESEHIYPHRWTIPHQVWLNFFKSAKDQIGILAYSSFFLFDDPEILQTFIRKAQSGVTVKIALGSPGSFHVKNRGDEEKIGNSMQAKIKNALILSQHLQKVEGIEIRTHDTILYNSIYQSDQRLMINPHIYGAPASNAPVIPFSKSTEREMYSTYTKSFNLVWENSKKFR
ncbi:XRE family transcriptional regulator [Nocardiopsis ansamitocini]|uniref:XRE family transcriptional regulator n=1 Tax=Nocardiopsis ansamitocini TaxID=1670832 RepID=UPI0025540F8C|nr:XRE family transcriptional regulator [Nocardiopsis ansamitocini]